jgi:hypothetical protein
MKPNPITEPESSGACAGSALRWFRVEGQWHAEPKVDTRYMAVPALGDWYACVMVGTKYKRGETLSPTSGETEEEAKGRCEVHWQNRELSQPPSVDNPQAP